jgi:hypothetical protein
VTTAMDQYLQMDLPTGEAATALLAGGTDTNSS